MGMVGKDDIYELALYLQKFYLVVGLNYIPEETWRGSWCVFPTGFIIMIFTNTEVYYNN